MSRSFNGSTQDLYLEDDLSITGYPATIFCWHKATTADDRPVLYFANTATNYAYINHMGAQPTVYTKYQLAQQFTAANTAGSPTATINTWEPVVITMINSNPNGKVVKGTFKNDELVNTP